MEKMEEINHLNSTSLNIEKMNKEKLKNVFPECFTEGKLEIDKLLNLCGEYIDNDCEKYKFEWKGKAECYKIAGKPSNGTLRPCPEESVNFDTTKNMYIEGDNLEVLKLLQTSYYRKVKMIYIDPPYNTGNDFVYEDDFADPMAKYKEVTQQTTKSNPETMGRFHTKWLNMMFPRLRLAANLLKDDGVIFISIDDNEVHNLRKLCDEVLGEENFIAQICHKARASVSNDKIISNNHNHIILYAKCYEEIFKQRDQIGLDPILDGFNLKDENGYYKLMPVDGPGGAKKGNPFYEFLGISGYWRFSKETMQQKYENGLIVKTENSLQQKYYLSQAKSSRRTDTTWWDNDVLTSNATKDFIKLMGGKYFDNPKSINLIIRMLKAYTHNDKNAIILDFFSGSATTAHAVMQLNAEDGGNRKFIMVQLPERCDEKSEAFQAGYKNICEIGKKRIRRAGKKILDQFPSAEVASEGSGQVLPSIGGVVEGRGQEFPSIGGVAESRGQVFPSLGGVAEGRGQVFPSLGGVAEGRGQVFPSFGGVAEGRGGLRNTKNYLSLPYNPALKERARELRKAGNLSEVLLWNEIKNKQFKGLDFDRQKIIGNYIVDFYCASENVVIEIDGTSHADKQEYDETRDKYLNSLGLTVIHILDIDVKKNLDGVMEMLYNHPALTGTPPHDENSSLRLTDINPKKGNTSQAQKPPLDIGFKVFKLDTSNLVEWDSTPTQDEQVVAQRFSLLNETIKPDRNDLDVVYEVMLKMGIPLDYKVIPTEINDKKAYSIGEDCLVLICLDFGKDGITPEDIKEMCELVPAKIVSSEQAFKDSTALSNAYYILKDHNIEMKLL